MEELINKIQLDKIDTSSSFQNYLLIYENRYFEINERLYFILNCLVNKKLNLKVTTKEYNLNYEKKHTELYIQNLIHFEINNKLLNKANITESSFKFKKTLISSQKLNPLTDKLTIFFSSYLFYILNILSVFCALYFVITTTTPQSYKLSDIFIASFLIFISVIFHEIGHATACRLYKVEHGDIGLALYLYFPIFYADVSNVWQLSRKKRLIVNYAGIYFQLIFLLPFFVLHFYFENTFTNLIINSILISFLFDLNPFFKFDGYWLASDLLGVPNLRERTNELLSFYIKKIFGSREIKSIPYFFNIKKNIQWWFFGYSISVNLFFIYIFFYKIPLYLYTQIIYVLNFKIKLFDIENWQSIFTLIINVLFLILIVYSIYNSIIRLFKLLKQ